MGQRRPQQFTADALHQFQLALTWYVCDALRTHLPTVSEGDIDGLRAEATQQQPQEPEPLWAGRGSRPPRRDLYPRWSRLTDARRQFALGLAYVLSPALASFIMPESEAPTFSDLAKEPVRGLPTRLLGSHELGQIAEALDDLANLKVSRIWHHRPAVHRLFEPCVSEIRELSRKSAREFHSLSTRIARRLAQDSLTVESGVKQIHKWMRRTEKYLRQMSRFDFLAYPQGTFPTATSPRDATPSGITPNVAGIIARYRARNTEGALRNKSVDELQKILHGKRVDLVEAIQHLDGIGEHTPRPRGRPRKSRPPR